MDLSMPGVSGLETIKRITGSCARTRILVFSMHDDAALAERAMKLGARGYVTKSSAPETLGAAVTEIVAGKLYLSADIAKSIALLRLTGNEHPVNALSSREFEIFRQFVTGRSLADIARTLNLSGKTISNYHTLIKHKLDTSSDVELVLLAARHKLV